MQQLRDLVLQLRTDNKWHVQEWDASGSGSGGSSVFTTPASHGAPAGVITEVTGRFIVVPRDRKCPTFNGKTRIGVFEWMISLCG